MLPPRTLASKVKVFLRNFETAQYFGDGKWVVDSAEAFDFSKAELAIQFCKDHNLPKMEVVLRYDKPVSEMAFRVP